MIILVLLTIFLIACLLYVLMFMNFMKKKKLLYDIDESKGINIIKDSVYKQIGTNNLLMDIYTPEKSDPKAKLPVVIFVHGEGPEIFIKDAKDGGLYSNYGKLLSSMGYAAITFNHPRASSNFSKINEVSKDILDAVEHVRKNAELWNIDVNRICVWTFSLGGIYTGLFLNNNEKKVKCLISYYGLLDIYAKISKHDDMYEKFTPEEYLSNLNSNECSILIVKAAKDKTEAVNKSIDKFIQEAEANSIKYDYVIHNTGGHAFDVMNDNNETRNVIRKTLEFIKENL